MKDILLGISLVSTLIFVITAYFILFDLVKNHKAALKKWRKEVAYGGKLSELSKSVGYYENKDKKMWLLSLINRISYIVIIFDIFLFIILFILRIKI